MIIKVGTANFFSKDGTAYADLVIKDGILLVIVVVRHGIEETNGVHHDRES